MLGGPLSMEDIHEEGGPLGAPLLILGVIVLEGVCL